MTKAENKCTVTIKPGGYAKIEVVSTGHPLDELIALMLKRLQKGNTLNT